MTVVCIRAATTASKANRFHMTNESVSHPACLLGGFARVWRAVWPDMWMVNAAWLLPVG